MIEINLTPNRPDCTGVSGIARDLAAADIGAFKERTPKPIKGEFPCPPQKLDFGLTHPLCPASQAWPRVRGVAKRPVLGLAAEVHRIGLRPINALVDITNFIVR